MAILITSPSSLLPIKGIRIATAAAGLRYKDRDDTVLIALSKHVNTAAIFTKNQFCAAPVQLAKRYLNNTQPRYLLINSGNANAGTGETGLADAVSYCIELAKVGQCDANEVLPFSTGVIGERLPIDKLIQKFPELLNKLKEDAWLEAAQAIMTTDTVSKGVSKQIVLDGHKVSITGITKGAGMIRPNMATMLAFVATDLQIDTEQLNSLLKDAVDNSFHCITVDGDTSTNDACVLMASGSTGVSFANLSNQAKHEFVGALNSIFIKLAQSIICDGEGATKFITIRVEQALDTTMAREIAFTIAHSPLVKTAAFASDPNWGRILAAIGRANVSTLRMNKLSLYINELQVVENGELASTYDEEKGIEEMQKTELTFLVKLGMGEEVANIWTTDLSHEYVKINAEYRT